MMGEIMFSMRHCFDGRQARVSLFSTVLRVSSTISHDKSRLRVRVSFFLSDVSWLKPYVDYSHSSQVQWRLGRRDRADVSRASWSGRDALGCRGEPAGQGAG